MDYEKRYKEALERAKNLHKDAIDLEDKHTLKVSEIIFPELKKSEDEKIRKELVFYLGDMPEDTELRNGVTNRDVLAWLEKQGEKKPDIFIEKAADKFKQLMYDQHFFEGMVYQDVIIENLVGYFKTYMKGE